MRLVAFKGVWLHKVGIAMLGPHLEWMDVDRICIATCRDHLPVVVLVDECVD